MVESTIDSTHHRGATIGGDLITVAMADLKAATPAQGSRSVRVIGYSHSRRAILTVILVYQGEGTYYGANGWESNPADQRRYREAQ